MFYADQVQTIPFCYYSIPKQFSAFEKVPKKNEERKRRRLLIPISRTAADMPRRMCEDAKSNWNKNYYCIGIRIMLFRNHFFIIQSIILEGV